MSDTDDNQSNKDVPPWLQPVPDAEESAAGVVGSRRTLIAAGVAVTLVVVFVTALVFLYEDTPPPPRVVTADAADIRTKPDDPGGMEVNHQDKQIFEAADGNEPVARVELSPRAEQPLEEIPNLEAKPVEGTTLEIAQSQDKIGDIAAEVMGEQQTADGTADQRAVATPKVEKTQPVAPANVSPPAATEAPAATVDSYSVQLGAYGTEQSAARAWRAVKARFSTQLGELQPIFVPVEAGNRTLYRLRAGPIANRDDADAVCIALRAQEQGCFVVNP